MDGAKPKPDWWSGIFTQGKAFSSLDAWLQVYLDLVSDLILVADLLSKAHFADL